MKCRLIVIHKYINGCQPFRTTAIDRFVQCSVSAQCTVASGCRVGEHGDVFSRSGGPHVFV